MDIRQGKESVLISIMLAWLWFAEGAIERMKAKGMWQEEVAGPPINR